MTQGRDIHGRVMIYEKRTATSINKCFDCGEIIEKGWTYYKIIKPQEMSVCERCGKRRKCI
jgi:ribosomal protein L32